jgi:predicted alternative tryptophan synthase beta-subunit
MPGGLRYHGMAPLVSHIYELGLVEAISIPQTECFEGALQFARTEGHCSCARAHPRNCRSRARGHGV